MDGYLEIVDTAVKIGLGALISGVATYYVTKSKHTHEIEKEAKLRRSELLEEISVAIQSTANAITKAMHVATNATKQADDEKMLRLVSEAVDVFLEAFKQLNSAEGRANLLGESELNSVLDRMREETLQLYYEMRSDDLDWDVVNETIERVNDVLSDVPDVLANAYRSVWGAA